MQLAADSGTHIVIDLQCKTLRYALYSVFCCPLYTAFYLSVILWSETQSPALGTQYQIGVVLNRLNAMRFAPCTMPFAVKYLC